VPHLDVGLRNGAQRFFNDVLDKPRATLNAFNGILAVQQSHGVLSGTGDPR
jgi:hypothetical protein